MGQLICYYTVNREGNGGEKYPGKVLIYKHYSTFYRKQKQEKRPWLYFYGYDV